MINMKYENEIADVNYYLKIYARSIINDSPYKDNWTYAVKELFVESFVRDEIQKGRTQAEINLIKSLETEYRMC